MLTRSIALVAAASVLLAAAPTANAKVFLHGKRVTVTLIGATSYRPCHKRHKNRCGTAILDLRWGGDLVERHTVHCINPRALVLRATEGPTDYAYVRACGHHVHQWGLS